MRGVLTLVVLTVLGGARGADAQVSGYAVAGLAGFHGFFGSSSSGGAAAGGAEALIAGRAGVAAEGGILVNSGSGLMVYSLNGVLHLLSDRRPSKVSPFVTGGYTKLSSGEGTFNAWNAGAGVHVWPASRVGVRAEFRDHVRPDSRGDVHYWMLRAGVVIR